MTAILIVDDSPTMRKMLRAALRNLAEAFYEASNGLEAIEQLALHPIDLITLDLNMPDMHGFEFLRFVRAHSRHRHTPVIVITTRGDEASRDEALRSGADAYLTKPFQVQDLRKQVTQLLAKPYEHLAG